MALKSNPFISPIWRNAYILLCTWFMVNLMVATTFEYIVFRPFPSTLINGLLLGISICIMAFFSWKLSAWLFQYSVPIQVLGHIFGIITWFYLATTVSYFLEYYFDGFQTLDEWKEYVWEQFGSKSLLYNLEYVTAIALFYILKYIDTIRIKENEKAKLAITNNEMKLSLLKSQINPHFLFNTLNSISTLMSTNKTKARQMMTMLSDVLRYALDSNSFLQVPLGDELDFIRNYIHIQQIRFGERLKYEEQIDKSCLALTIPPMVLQPLVENSVKHGITPKEEGGTITLSIKRVNSHVEFRVSDDGVGLSNKTQYESSNSGVGLVNSDMRLQNMYGTNSRIRIIAEEQGFIVHFKIPANEES